MSKAVAKVTIEQQKKTAKTNKYLGSGDILREQLDLYKIEATKLDDELLVMAQTYTSVASVRHERKLKDKGKEGAVKRCKDIIEARESICTEEVDKLETRIEKKKGAMLQLQKEIELLEKQQAGERTKANRIINEQTTLLNSYYELATIEVPVEVKYPPTYYKKEQQKKDLDRVIKNITKNIATIDALGPEADQPVEVELKGGECGKKQLGNTPWAVLGVDFSKDPEDVKRNKLREQARREDAERKRIAEQQDAAKEHEKYMKEHEVIAKLRKAEEEFVVAEEEKDISDEDISDEKDNQIRIDILKKDISDLNYFIQDMIEELATNPSNSVLEAELNINKEKRMDMKKELKERIRKVF